MKKIIAFSGSNSSTSINQQFIKAVATMISGYDVEVIDLRDYPAPLFGVDLEKEISMPDTILKLKEKMKEADGYIISTPEHNGSMPAFFKNTIDWLSRIEKAVFNDKPTLFLSTSEGARGGMSALGHLVAIMPFRGAKIVGSFSLGQFGKHVKDGKLDLETSEALQPELQKLFDVL